MMSDIFNKIDSIIDTGLSDNKESLDGEVAYLSKQAPNVVQWVTGIEYWGAFQTYEFSRQYEILRDMFNCRCKICNSQDPEAISCWKKPRSYLESEILFEWNDDHNDFVCPKCRSTMREHLDDGLITPYNELICIAGMRSGKSYLGAHIAGYLEHVLRVMSMQGKGHVQRMFGMQQAEWLDLTFAASTATQAQHTIYAKYREMRNNSKWVNRHVAYIKEMEAAQASGTKEKWSYAVKSETIEDGWLQVRFNRSASDASGVAGRTRVLGAIDEWARLIDTDGTRSAKELYAVMNQSLKTVRAAVDNNKLFPFFGLMVNVTSAWAADDPAMELYNKAADGLLKRTYYWKGPTWEFNPKITKENLADDFIKDKAAAERDFASNPPLASSPFIERPHLFWQCIDYDREPLITFKETTVHDKTGKFYNAVQVADCKLDTSGTPYYAFMDAGLNWDCFGFAIGHGEYRSLKDFDIEEGQYSPMDLGIDPLNPQVDDFETGSNLEAAGFSKISQAEGYEPLGKSNGFVQLNPMGLDNRYGDGDEVFVTVVDGVFRIIPSETNEVWYNSIIDIVNSIHKRINFVGLSSDRWNSASLLQQLRSYFGIQADNYRLRPEDFMSFLHMCYGGRVSLLPPEKSDGLVLDEAGQLLMKKPQEEMGGSTIGIVELLKLNRDPTLRRFFNDKKGVVRGRDSDDIARCIIGLNYIVQDSQVNHSASKSNRTDFFSNGPSRTKNMGMVFNPRKY
jgi:hypothetical protein